MALETVWAEAIRTNELTTENLNALADWALRVYFGPSNEGKRWYRSTGVTRENVLDQFLLPDSPISPEAMVEVWKAIPTLRVALERLDNNELDAVADYLQRPKGNVDTVPKYTQGDCTLKEMAKTLGGITGTMVNKIFVSGADKLHRLTGGVSPMDMEDDDMHSMLSLVEHAQLIAAAEYAAALLSFNGDIPGFVKSQVEALNLTEIEARAITPEECDGLLILSEMEQARIIMVLLEDLNSNDNLFLGFQNAASKKVFPRRSGRPKGSGKKKLSFDVLESSEIVVSATDDNEPDMDINT